MARRENLGYLWVLPLGLASDLQPPIVCAGFRKKNPLLMYATIRFGTASKAAPQGRHLYRAGVGVELRSNDCQPDALTIRPRHPFRTPNQFPKPIENVELSAK
jgi:hypothetical protein